MCLPARYAKMGKNGAVPEEMVVWNMSKSFLHPDYSVLNKLELKETPMGVKFDFFRPENVPPLEKDAHMSLCEIFRMAQKERRPLYFSRENDETCVGKILLGMEDMAPLAESGQIGARLKAFQEPRANQHIYQHVTRLDKDSVNYVSFAPVDQMTFEPDVLVISGNSKQAEMVLRAAAYSTGMVYESRCTTVMGCSWFLLYPYKTGKINYVVPDLVHGPAGRQLYDEAGIFLISIPYQWIPTVMASLEEMTLHLEGHKNKSAYYSEFEGILKDLGERAKNP